MLLRLCWLALAVAFAIAVTGAGVTKVAAASVKFDQSQTGEYNVQIHLKNLELYALLDESILNAEYDYDYADLTEKPPKPTPAKPTEETNVALECVEMTKYGVVYRKNSANCSNVTAVAAAIAAFATTTKPLPTTPEPLPASAGNTVGAASGAPPSTSEPLATTTTTEAPYSPQPEVGTFALKKCGMGYFRDNLGRCRRIRKPHLPFLHMIHTPGVIKSFNGDVARKLPSTTPSAPHK